MPRPPGSPRQTGSRQNLVPVISSLVRSRTERRIGRDHGERRQVRVERPRGGKEDMLTLADRSGGWWKRPFSSGTTVCQSRGRARASPARLTDRYTSRPPGGDPDTAGPGRYRERGGAGGSGICRISPAAAALRSSSTISFHRVDRLLVLRGIQPEINAYREEIRLPPGKLGTRLFRNLFWIASPSRTTVYRRAGFYSSSRWRSRAGSPRQTGHSR